MNYLVTFKEMKKILIIGLSFLMSCSHSDFKSLEVSKVNPINELNLETISKVLDSVSESQPIDLLNWKDYEYAPQVAFKIAHSEEMIYLKFNVSEDHIIAKRTETNSSTHRDSCVEFFIPG